MEEIQSLRLMSKGHALYSWSNSLSDDQIAFLCDVGWYNTAIEGYMIKAAENAGMTSFQINSLKERLKWAFDELTMQEAVLLATHQTTPRARAALRGKRGKEIEGR